MLHFSIFIFYFNNGLSALYSYGFTIAVSYAVIYQLLSIAYAVLIAFNGDFIGLRLPKVKSSDLFGFFYVCGAVFYLLSFAPLLFFQLGSV